MIIGRQVTTICHVIQKRAIKPPIIGIWDMGLTWKYMWFLKQSTGYRDIIWVCSKNCGFTSNMAVLMRKWWSTIKIWGAPYFQTNPSMWVPWICSMDVSIYLGYNIIHTLWLFKIAMENGPFMDDFSFCKGFSMAMLNNQRVIHNEWLFNGND